MLPKIAKLKPNEVFHFLMYFFNKLASNPNAINELDQEKGENAIQITSGTFPILILLSNRYNRR
jgi:hypothetical protein